MEQKLIEPKSDVCGNSDQCTCHDCSKPIRNCADCTEDSKVIKGLIDKPNKSQACHLTTYFCSVKKLRVQEDAAKKGFEVKKKLECPYCGTKDSFSKGYLGVICKICNYSFDPNDKNAGKLPKELMDREHQERDKDGEIKKLKPQRHEDHGFRSRKSNVTGTEEFSVGEFGNVINDLKKGKKIIIGP